MSANLYTERIRAAGIPAEWELIFVKDKKPYQNGWQTGFKKSWAEIETELRSGRANGVGLRTGNGLLAIDLDGHSAGKEFARLGGSPATVAWSSGKAGRVQLLFSVPQDKIAGFTRSVIQTGAGEQIEFRYERCQSVMPGSAHPETDGYRWVKSPANVAIIECPAWVLEHIEQSLSEQRRPKAGSIPSDPSLNPWDVRNLIPFIEGYNPAGRAAGWATCRCPVHGGSSLDSLHINSATGAFRCQNDCDTRAVYQAAKAQAIAAGYRPEPVTPLLAKIERILGIAKSAPAPSTADIVYKRGELKETLQLARQIGYKFVQDKTGTGGGKTYQTARLQPQDLDLEKLIYASTDSRNVCDSELRQWEHVEARHGGLATVVEAGNTRVRRAKEQDKIYVEANCSYPSSIAKLRERGLDANNFCKLCPKQNDCGKTSGNGFGFRSERAAALKADRLIMHPASRPSEKEFDYEFAAQIFDEAASLQTIRRTILTRSDIRISLENAIKDGNQPLVNFLMGVCEALDRPDHHGVEHNDLFEALTPLAKLITAQPTDDSVEFLGQLRENLPGDTALTSVLDGYLGGGALRMLIEHLQGGTFEELSAWTSRGSLYVETRDGYADSINEAAAFNLLLSADINRERAAAAFGIQPEDLLVIEQESECKGELEIIQVTGLGKLTKSSTGESWARADAAIAEIKKQIGDIPAITFKGRESNGDGAHFRDSAGTNAFGHLYELMLVGTPTKNLHSLRSEYILGGGDPLDKVAEQAFFDSDTRSTYLQEAGRLRHNRKEGKHRLFILSDFETGLPVNRVIHAGQLSEACLGKGDVMRKRIHEAADQLKAQGSKVTQQAVAEIVGCAQQLVSKVFQSFTTFPIESVIGKVVIPKLASGERVKNTVSIDSATGIIPPGTLGRVLSRVAAGCAMVVFGESPPVLATVDELEVAS